MRGVYFNSLPAALDAVAARGAHPSDRLVAAAEIAFVSQSLAHALAVLVRVDEEKLYVGQDARPDFHTHATNLAVLIDGLMGELSEALEHASTYPDAHEAGAAA